ncbi:MAG: zinc ribbon domain-containing protein [Candidatus Hodarchaeota archaeon]
MNRNQKKGLISFISGLGVIFLLVGIFTHYYTFGTGLVVAMVFWILSGALSTFLGINEETAISPQHSYQGDHLHEAPATFEKTATGALYCARCGSKIEKGSRFCSICGADIE